MGRVAGKIAIITGGARGLGAATAGLLAAEGARVVITDLDEEAGRQTAARIGDQGGDCRFRHQDVTDEAGWTELVEAVVADCGGLHILVNNAGIVLPGPVEEETLAGFRKTMAVNLDAVFMGTKQAIIAMRESGGSVINLSSIEGLIGNPDIIAYNASKGGVRLLTKSAALYCIEQGYKVRVNSVHPGIIETDMVRDGLDMMGPEAWEKTLATIPGGEMGRPIDVANGVLYLASDEAAYVNGSELVIDGGFTAR